MKASRKKEAEREGSSRENKGERRKVFTSTTSGIAEMGALAPGRYSEGRSQVDKSHEGGNLEEGGGAM